jgi:hypothetical protein
MRTDTFNPAQTIIAEVQVAPGFAEGPERNLLTALLFDGIQSYMAYFFAKGASAKTKYREAYSWIHKRGDDYVFSFENVCEALGIDPEYLRLGIANACATQAYGRTRSRRRF